MNRHDYCIVEGTWFCNIYDGDCTDCPIDCNDCNCKTCITCGTWDHARHDCHIIVKAAKYVKKNGWRFK